MARYEKSQAELRTEKFIENKLNKEREAWKNSLPKILEDLTTVIKYHPERNNIDWISTLPKLRELYAKARSSVDDSKVSESTIRLMCEEINKFTHNMRLILCKRETGGIDSSYWLSFKATNQWIKPKDAVSRINVD